MALAKPNTQPIYTNTIINWDVRLTTQVTDRVLTTTPPEFIGTFGTFGGIIWNIRAVPLGNNAPTTLRIFGARTADSVISSYSLLFEVALPRIVSDVNASGLDLVGTNVATDVHALSDVEVPLPRIYSRNTEESRGLVREGGYSLYASLGVAVASGWDLHLEGGEY